MKKIIYILNVLLLSITLVSCSNAKLEKIVVAASPTPHAEILEFAKPLLKELGYNLEIKKYNDYIMPNQALTLDQVDANYFQHEPYLNAYNSEYNTNIISVAKIHIEPIGIYSKKYSSLNDVEDNALVLLSKSKSDHGRLIKLLVDANLITLNDNIDPFNATFDDINENPKNLRFDTSIAPELLIDAYNTNQGDLILINSNFALSGGLKPGSDALILESAINNPYSNIIATTEKYLNSDKINALVKVLNSDEVKNFILEKWSGDIVVS